MYTAIIFSLSASITNQLILPQALTQIQVYTTNIDFKYFLVLCLVPAHPQNNKDKNHLTSSIKTDSEKQQKQEHFTFSIKVAITKHKKQSKHYLFHHRCY